jgi:hypothetical protein
LTETECSRFVWPSRAAAKLEVVELPCLRVRRMSAGADAGWVLDIELEAGQSSSARDRRLVATIIALRSRGRVSRPRGASLFIVTQIVPQRQRSYAARDKTPSQTGVCGRPAACSTESLGDHSQAAAMFCEAASQSDALAGPSTVTAAEPRVRLNSRCRQLSLRIRRRAARAMQPIQRWRCT